MPDNCKPTAKFVTIVAETTGVGAGFLNADILGTPLDGGHSQFRLDFVPNKGAGTRKPRKWQSDLDTTDERSASSSSLFRARLPVDFQFQ